MISRWSSRVARLRRRSDHRADDQHRSRCARLRRRREISAARRAQLGPAPRHAAARPHGHDRILARGQRRHAHAGDDRNARPRSTTSRRSPQRRASMRCSSAPTTSSTALSDGTAQDVDAPEVEQAIDAHLRRRREGRQDSRHLLHAMPSARWPWQKRGFRFIAVGSDSASARWHRRAAEALKA